MLKKLIIHSMHMKNLYIFLLSTVILIFSISACGGESEEEKQARLQAYQDSLRAVEQAKIEAMMAAMEDSVAMAERNAMAQEMEEITHQYNDYDWNYSLWNHVRHRRFHDVTASLKSRITGA